MKITVRNRTAYPTAKIARTVRAAREWWGLKRDCVVEVAYAKGGHKNYVRGRAAYPFDRNRWPKTEVYMGTAEGTWIKLWLQPPSGEKLTLRDWTWLVSHEVAHNKGVSHPNMGNTPIYKWWDFPDCGLPKWADESFEMALPAEAPEPTHAEKLDARERLLQNRATKVRTMLTAWERKLKLAKTKVAKLQAKVRYYEQRALAPEAVAARATRPAPVRKSKAPAPKLGDLDANGDVIFCVGEKLWSDIYCCICEVDRSEEEGGEWLDSVAKRLRENHQGRSRVRFTVPKSMLGDLHTALSWVTGDNERALEKLDDAVVWARNRYNT